MNQDITIAYGETLGVALMACPLEWGLENAIMRRFIIYTHHQILIV
jgi:hypothetical protein